MLCNKCGIELTEKNWSKNQRKTRNYTCDSCWYKYRREYYLKHLEQENNRIKKWCLEHPDRRKNHVKKYRQTHKEQYNKTRKKYRKTHREQENKQHKKWVKKNPEKAKEMWAKHVHKRRGLGFDILNEPFEGAIKHHIDKKCVVYIPEQLHNSIRHSVLKNKNMTEINDKVFEWLIEHGDAKETFIKNADSVINQVIKK